MQPFGQILDPSLNRYIEELTHRAVAAPMKLPQVKQAASVGELRYFSSRIEKAHGRPEGLFMGMVDHCLFDRVMGLENNATVDAVLDEMALLKITPEAVLDLAMRALSHSDSKMNGWGLYLLIFQLVVTGQIVHNSFDVIEAAILNQSIALRFALAHFLGRYSNAEGSERFLRILKGETDAPGEDLSVEELIEVVELLVCVKRNSLAVEYMRDLVEKSQGTDVKELFLYLNASVIDQSIDQSTSLMLSPSVALLFKNDPIGYIKIIETINRRNQNRDAVQFILVLADIYMDSDEAAQKECAQSVLKIVEGGFLQSFEIDSKKKQVVTRLLLTVKRYLENNAHHQLFVRLESQGFNLKKKMSAEDCNRLTNRQYNIEKDWKKREPYFVQLLVYDNCQSNVLHYINNAPVESICGLIKMQTVRENLSLSQLKMVLSRAVNSIPKNEVVAGFVLDRLLLEDSKDSLETVYEAIGVCSYLSEERIENLCSFFSLIDESKHAFAIELGINRSQPVQLLNEEKVIQYLEKISEVELFWSRLQDFKTLGWISYESYRPLVSKVFEKAVVHSNYNVMIASLHELIALSGPVDAKSISVGLKLLYDKGDFKCFENTALMLTKRHHAVVIPEISDYLKHCSVDKLGLWFSLLLKLRSSAVVDIFCSAVQNGYWKESFYFYQKIKAVNVNGENLDQAQIDLITKGADSLTMLQLKELYRAVTLNEAQLIDFIRFIQKKYPDEVFAVEAILALNSPDSIVELWKSDYDALQHSSTLIDKLKNASEESRGSIYLQLVEQLVSAMKGAVKGKDRKRLEKKIEELKPIICRFVECNALSSKLLKQLIGVLISHGRGPELKEIFNLFDKQSTTLTKIEIFEQIRAGWKARLIDHSFVVELCRHRNMRPDARLDTLFIAMAYSKTNFHVALRLIEVAFNHEQGLSDDELHYVLEAYDNVIQAASKGDLIDLVRHLENGCCVRLIPPVKRIECLISIIELLLSDDVSLDTDETTWLFALFFDVLKELISSENNQDKDFCANSNRLVNRLINASFKLMLSLKGGNDQLLDKFISAVWRLVVGLKDDKGHFVSNVNYLGSFAFSLDTAIPDMVKAHLSTTSGIYEGIIESLQQKVLANPGQPLGGYKEVIEPLAQLSLFIFGEVDVRLNSFVGYQNTAEALKGLAYKIRKEGNSLDCWYRFVDLCDRHANICDHEEQWFFGLFNYLISQPITDFSSFSMVARLATYISARLKHTENEQQIPTLEKMVKSLMAHYQKLTQVDEPLDNATTKVKQYALKALRINLEIISLKRKQFLCEQRGI